MVELDLLDSEALGFDPMDLVKALPGMLKGTGQALAPAQAAPPAPPPPPPPAAAARSAAAGALPTTQAAILASFAGAGAGALLWRDHRIAGGVIGWFVAAPVGAVLGALLGK